MGEPATEEYRSGQGRPIAQINDDQLLLDYVSWRIGIQGASTRKVSESETDGKSPI